MQNQNIDSTYAYTTSNASEVHSYLWPAVLQILAAETPPPTRIFEVGCGNGATANMLGQHGMQVTAIDPAVQGIEQAKKAFPEHCFVQGSAYDDLVAEYGTFPAVLSLEVVEHCFWPRQYAKTIFDLLVPGGVAIISTPYHGYWKNLLLALTGKFDQHWSPLWDGGHIKFWSEKTLSQLLVEVGFSNVTFKRVGRIAPLAKSMIAIARR